MVCIGVIGAMEEEVASLINQMEDAESKTMAGMTFNKESYGIRMPLLFRVVSVK